MTELLPGKPNGNFRAAMVQTCTSCDVQHNIEEVTAQIRQAAANGADYIQTPEVSVLMEARGPAQIAKSEPDNNSNPAIVAFGALAKELGIWLHIGSMSVRNSEEKLANRSFLFRPDGEVAARYDKIHMFDVAVDADNRYNESRRYDPGERAVISRLPWGNLGLTICYDMRFPGLYRSLAKAGAHFIAVPSAFTIPTGKAHWHTLLRARAIETQCFVFAAAQVGEHESGRKTYGHSIIISPWGDVLAEADGLNKTVIYSNIETETLDTVRNRVPSLCHDRPFDVTSS